MAFELNYFLNVNAKRCTVGQGPFITVVALRFFVKKEDLHPLFCFKEKLLTEPVKQSPNRSYDIASVSPVKIVLKHVG